MVSFKNSRYKSCGFLVAAAALLIFASMPGFGQTPPPPIPANQNNNDITNEYRLTLVISRPVSEKVTLFGYLGVVKAPDKSVSTLYYSPPGVIYSPKPWLELWAGMFGLYNKNQKAANSWELRPLLGVKFYIPNKLHANLYSFTRQEFRFINQNHNTTTIPRLRNRVGIDIPLSQTKAWTPKTFYTMTDVEPIWRLDNKSLQLIRARAGLGYIISKTYRAEFIYYAEFSGDKGQPKNYTGNIWRLNFKITLPRRGQHDQRRVPDIDE
jgi:Protein of unknown function (DUF2490)